MSKIAGIHNLENITQWQTFTMTITGSSSNPTRGTVTTEKAVWRRNGDSIEISYLLVMTTAGSAGSGNYLFRIPNSLTADSTKVSFTTAGFNATNTVVGHAMLTSNTAVETGVGNVFVYSDGINLTIATLNSTKASEGLASGSGQGDFSTANMRIGFFAKVPIVGWK